MKAIAKSQNYKGYTKLKKADLIELLKKGKPTQSQPITTGTINCPSNKVLNKKSGKCVLKTGKIGKQILAEQNTEQSVQQIGIQLIPQPSGDKVCPSNKVLNKKSGKCVLKTGKIGLQLLTCLLSIDINSL